MVENVISTGHEAFQGCPSLFKDVGRLHFLQVDPSNYDVPFPIQMYKLDRESLILVKGNLDLPASVNLFTS